MSISATKTITLNSDVKKKWVEALRSGKYKQGELALRTRDDTFCCLGVLLDVCYPMRWMKPKSNNNLYSHRNASSDNASYTLGAPIRKKVGLSIDDMNCLINMNDMVGSSFDNIADYIERKL